MEVGTGKICTKDVDRRLLHSLRALVILKHVRQNENQSNCAFIPGVIDSEPFSRRTPSRGLQVELGERIAPQRKRESALEREREKEKAPQSDSEGPPWRGREEEEL